MSSTFPSPLHLVASWPSRPCPAHALYFHESLGEEDIIIPAPENRHQSCRVTTVCMLPHTRARWPHYGHALEEVDELAFLFGAQDGPNLDGLGRVLDIDLHDLDIFDGLEGAVCGKNGQTNRSERCSKAQLLYLHDGDCGGG
jgi:hypothetical protein